MNRIIFSIARSNILKFEDYVFTIESSAPSFSVSSEKEKRSFRNRNLRTKAQLYEIPRFSSVAWFCSPPSHHISRFLRKFRHFGVYEVLRSCPMSPLRDLSKQSLSPLARCNVLPKRSYFSLLLNYVPKLCFGFETLAGSLGWNHVQSSERTLFLFDEVKVFARRRYICSNSSGITRIIAYRSIVSTREYTSVGRGNWRIER